MTIHNFEQYGPEWWAIRNGRINASEAGPFMVNSGKVADAAVHKLLCKKIAELAGEVEEIFPNDAMKRGTALEPIARQEYAACYRSDVRQVGFVSHDTLPLGCSPDGLVYQGDIIMRGLEIKCPQPATHVHWLLDGGLPDEHKWQIHMCMALTGATEWDFWSFCPRVTRWTKTRDAWTVDEWEENGIPPLHVRVNRNGFTDELMVGLKAICVQYEGVRRQMAQLWQDSRVAS